MAKARSVLELGPGTGAFTTAIDEVLPEGASYLGLELNQTFVDQLRQQHPRMRFEAAPCQEFDFAGSLGPDCSFDSIVSGLPWTNFPAAAGGDPRSRAAQATTGRGVCHLCYAGFHMLPQGQRFRALLKERCVELRTSSTVWGNLPPAFVYEAVVVSRPEA
ncbi:methyltransferase domain-containing protein [Verrucomicrobium spinosum]|uniref:methyltransferase domain-containing protein n=1 Tax=Verrucomicrobium spinosum TaxID=2736 RepID=UPI0009463940|nr:methyltransferase domain-containing protein [Verrucomicrobium spinosum]